MPPDQVIIFRGCDTHADHIPHPDPGGGFPDQDLAVHVRTFELAATHQRTVEDVVHQDLHLRADPAFWGDDPSRVVVDEMVGVWIPLLLAADPLHRLWWALAALLLFRVFDIVKPFGIRRLDRRRGALWVMLDDVAAGLCSALVLGLIILITYAYTS